MNIFNCNYHHCPRDIYVPRCLIVPIICWLNELIEGSEQDLYKFSTAASDDDEDDDASNANNDDTEANDGRGWQCQGIDIGTGVSAIYPLLLTTKLFTKSKSSSSDDDDKETCVMMILQPA